MSFNAAYAWLNRPWCIAQAVYLSIVKYTKALSRFIMANTFDYSSLDIMDTCFCVDTPVHCMTWLNDSSVER